MAGIMEIRGEFCTPSVERKVVLHKGVVELLLLASVRVKMFRNIIDTGNVEIQPDVTCLVGKNESGKTAFLQALYRLRPTRPNVSFSIPEDYPAWLEKRDRRDTNLEEVRPVSAEFALAADEKMRVDETFGAGTLMNPGAIKLSKTYAGETSYTIEVDERQFVAHVIQSIDWPRGTKTEANRLTTVEQLLEYGERVSAEADVDEAAKAGLRDVIAGEIQNRLGGESLKDAVWRFLEPMIPSFLYWSEISELPYTVDVNKILTANPATLSDSELTARALLQIAGADDEYLRNPDYERRRRELENVANALTTDVLEYWTQNPDLRVQPDITQKTVNEPPGPRTVLDELKIRIWDQRHWLSLPFDRHSTGFRWFFSFLAAFFEHEHGSGPIIILLDEPALGLHARAQRDYLRFIDERLSGKSQVLYTTHSPFMVQSGLLERVRLVEDKGTVEGTKVSADVNSTDPDTLFPLQGALGYDLAQHLFIGANNLVVEGTSDHTYLRVLSDHFRASGGRESLDDRWSIVPVGGVDLVPTFVALLGNHLDLTVLVDATKRGYQKINTLIDQGILQGSRLVTPGMVVGKSDADIEDLFTDQEYIDLVNQAFGTSIKTGDLVGSDPIVRRLARQMNVDRFDHGRPADIFLRHRDEILPKLSEETFDRFSKLFNIINRTLP